MVFGAADEFSESCYTDLRKVFTSIRHRQRQFNWLITDCEAYPQKDTMVHLPG